MTDRMTPTRLRELAAWYREFAEKADSTSIWESRLRMAEDLESEADKIERDSNIKTSLIAMRKRNG